jgi:hypothetical protein
MRPHGWSGCVQKILPHSDSKPIINTAIARCTCNILIHYQQDVLRTYMILMSYIFFELQTQNGKNCKFIICALCIIFANICFQHLITTVRRNIKGLHIQTICYVINTRTVSYKIFSSVSNFKWSFPKITSYSSKT